MLGKGGMGYVVAARHLQLDQEVAIKILMPELTENEDAVARFLREARAAVRVRSEHIARVLDVGTLDDGTPFMVMEFLEGRDLAKEMKSKKSSPWGKPSTGCCKSARASPKLTRSASFTAISSPPTSFIRANRTARILIKILDFGISKALIIDGQPSQPSLTSTQGLMGSPHYMSPEQVRRPKDVDTRRTSGRWESSCTSS